MIVIDTHCDTLFRRALEKDKAPCVTKENLLAGGVSLQTCTLFAGFKGMDGQPYEKAIVQLAELDTLKSQGWKQVDSPFDAKEGECAVLLSLEGGEILEDKVERVHEFRAHGARLIALTWNHENLIASPAKGGSTDGIKPFGWSILKAMADEHIAADVSHLNAAGFYDLIDKHVHPPLASHSCCDALRPHFRNLTDHQIKALIERGGWIGMNFYPHFLIGDEGRCAQVSDIVRHIDHIVQMGGEKHVGFGSDFDGIEVCPADCQSPASIPAILDGLRALGYPESTVEDIAGRNFLAYFKAIDV